MGRRAAFIMTVVSAAFFGTMAVFAELAYREGAEPLQLLAWRFGVATVVLGVVLTARSPRALRVTRHELGRFSVIGVFGYSAAALCFFFALRFVDASVVAILLYTYPAMMAIADAAFSRQRLDAGRVAALLLTFAGCFLVAGGLSAGVTVRWQGILLGVGAACGYTVYSMLSNRWGTGRSRLTLMVYMFACCAVVVVGVALLTGASLSAAGWSSSVWFYLAGIVVIPTFGGVLLWLEGMRGLGPVQAAIVSTLEPIFTIMLAALVLGERLSITQSIGAALVIAGILIAEWPGRRTAQEPAVL